MKSKTRKSKMTFQSVWADAYDDIILRHRINSIATAINPKNLIYLEPVSHYKNMTFDDNTKESISSSLAVAMSMVYTDNDICLGNVLKVLLIAIYCKDIPSEVVKYIRDKSWEIVNQVRWSNKVEHDYLSITKDCLFLLEDKVTSLQKV